MSSTTTSTYTVDVVSLTFDSPTGMLIATLDLSALPVPDGADSTYTFTLRPEAVGNRIVGYNLPDGEQALDAIVRETALRVSTLEPLADDVIAQNGGTDPRIQVTWQSPADKEKATQLDAHADVIEAARVFFTPPAVTEADQ